MGVTGITHAELDGEYKSVDIYIRFTNQAGINADLRIAAVMALGDVHRATVYFTLEIGGLESQQTYIVFPITIAGRDKFATLITNMRTALALYQ